MNPHRSSLLLVLLVATVWTPQLPATDANVLTGTGHIDLKLNATAPEIVPATGPRFVWKGNSLFLGSAESSQAFGSPLVFLMGQGTAAPDAVAILGGAGASGVAIGYGAQAQGSVAIGTGAWAAGPGSIAIGTLDDDGNNHATASGYGAVAIGPFSQATTWNSTAIGGNFATSTGVGSTALGFYVVVSGEFSAGLGSSVYVTGDYAAAIGHDAKATADYSFATGRTTTFAHGSVALGYFNKGNKRKNNTTNVDPVTPHSDDPLFTLGNGTAAAPANAFTVYRDGTVRLAKAAGGISMGQFN